MDTTSTSSCYGLKYITVMHKPDGTRHSTLQNKIKPGDDSPGYFCPDVWTFSELEILNLIVGSFYCFHALDFSEAVK